MIKVLDFWAEWCIDPQTPVLTENGYLPAQEIKAGQKLVTIDPKTYKKGLKNVRKIRVFKNTPSKKIVLETGRILIGDDNHLVLTEEGFKSLKDVEIGDKVLIDPTQTKAYYSDSDTAILKTTNNNFADKRLQELNLLPLKFKDSRLPILARLLGYVITDGYLYEDLKHNVYETHFYAGKEKDAQNIKNDLKVLGFEKLEIKRQIKDCQIQQRKFTIDVIRCRNFNRALFFLFNALGAPVGRKKNQAYFVPDWIMSGNLTLKREFLSGWLGGDGAKIAYHIKRGGYSSHHANFTVNAIEFHKEKDLEREGILYAKQLGYLLEELAVKVRKISSSDDEDGVVISLKVSTDYTSLLNLAKIGYAYAATKNANTSCVREFIKYRLFERKRYEQIKVAVLKWQAIGVSDRDIARNLQIPPHTAISWRYTHRETNIVHPSLSGEAIFTKWLETRQQNEFLWENIIETEDANRREVIGITVDLPHTIITNGIVSHNCGPCKFMEPLIEELEKEFKGKVDFEKINVDENQELTAKHGVMSIPTYIFLKDDKEVERIIGATQKENFIKSISKHE
ncbi:hypothetical protein A3A49_01750 [Candidatus Curtissbacteria bacterium RIFCSPLOWO2_01_FULL_38_11b]|uniref:Thioredoxin domain-containing protein n=1 Tax=Candidatus Curtissbacteria bacterium RIFCSPLOWO2_01_FULL_38_11b TaxID=1797725 RepID=A0A1F5H419_9BACT|nr:MAG: hypothetical protein A3A49_01750 [Candidatus Curtissbacteria bacterium RIFCSPLOWO2_01_FULL_38_11b]